MMKETTKKTLKKVLLILLGLVIFLMLAGYFTVQSLFAMAEASPYLGNVVSYQVFYQQEPVDLEEGAFTELLSQLRQARPTREVSVNDTPRVDAYYKIDMVVDEDPSSRYVFVYENQGKFYYEIPYGGIYETDQSVWSLLETA